MTGETPELYEDLIAIGTHVIVQKQSFRKLYKVSENGTLTLGKDKVEMGAIIRKPFWSTFKMVPLKTGPRNYSLEVSDRVESLQDLKNSSISGIDNRCIFDDGTSQKLSKDEILELREAGKSGKEIVGTLIENSKTFANKTEYSQEKYLKKKERKYSQYLVIHKPTVRALQEIYFQQDHGKICGLRMDTLALLFSYSDVKSEGLYLLYDSGSSGLVAAGMLNRIGAKTTGTLVHLHPGNFPQTTLTNAMNFPKEQLDRLLAVNIYSLIRMYYQTDSLNDSVKKEQHTIENSINIIEQILDAESCLEENDSQNIPTTLNDDLCIPISEKLQDLTERDVAKCPLECGGTKEIRTNNKRKQDDLPNAVPVKRPRWMIETENVVNLLKCSKAHGLIIVAKEHPVNIVKGLLPFLGYSRPFVIYHAYREPLEEAYVVLKERRDIINLRLFSNFLRSYQILPDRTHPDISMSDSGGYLLAGYLVE